MEPPTWVVGNQTIQGKNIFVSIKMESLHEQLIFSKPIYAHFLSWIITSMDFLSKQAMGDNIGAIPVILIRSITQSSQPLSPLEFYLIKRNCFQAGP